MYENFTEEKEVIELDLQRLLSALVSKAWLIGLVAVACAGAVLLGTVLFVTPQYQSSVLFYVNNNTLSQNEGTSGVTPSDISASQSLANTYIVILNTWETLTDVINHSGVDRTYEELLDMICAEPLEDTQVFRVVVTSPDPQEASLIAEAICRILPQRISGLIAGTAAQMVDSAREATRPSSPNYFKNTMIGFVLGLAVTAAVILLREIFDVTIRTGEDLERGCKFPLLVSVPEMDKANTVGGGISSAAAEAYKILRTKLQFSFADENNCRVIGVSSARAGEGKSVTAANLAYTLSQLGSRVLLMECDMRRPCLADRLPVQKAPGLSDFLAGQSPGENIVQLCGLEKESPAFRVITAGRDSPTPMELLSSARMSSLIAKLRQEYDYLILDLPPVGEVGDAMAVSGLTDGMLLVVRQKRCSRVALNAALRQFTFVGARILGVVYNCASEGGRGTDSSHRS